MKGQELQSLFEAYTNVYAEQNLTEEIVEDFSEEVEVAAQYFYEMGLNEDGVDILIEELGVEEFANFVYDIAEEYILTEARAGGARIEPVTAKGQKFKSGKPTGKSLQRLRDQKAKRKESEAKASESKPSGLKASLQRQSAVAAAAKKQPKKPGLLDRVAGAVSKGIERHNAANKSLNKAASETGKTLRKVGKAASTVARGVASGVSGTAKLAGHVARKGLSDEYIMGYLIDEGYATSEESAYAILENMSREWRQTILERELLGEEESDRMRDRQLERGGMGARASTSPAKTGTSKRVDPKKHAETSKKAVDSVRASIMAKYGKSALM